MPWRAGLAIGVVIISGYQVIRRLLPLLLLPEFWITSRLRRWGLRPLPGTYAFGDFITLMIKASRWLAWGAVMVVGVGIITWYAPPSVGNTTLALYIDQSVAWWYSLEGWVLTGEWASPAHAAPTIRPGVALPAPSGSTVAPSPATTPRAKVTPTPKPARTPTATPAYTIYIVQRGDSLSKIAKRYDVSVEDLVAINKVQYPSLLTDPASIEVGWALLIPKQE